MNIKKLTKDFFPFKEGDIIIWEIKNDTVIVQSPSIVHHFTIDEFKKI